ncbi:DUF2079 domain-containing protein, partial [Prochlorococcus marinus]
LLAVLRHYLLQSNAYDLGLFDQWIWLTSKNLPSYSTMTGLHMFADHGAWTLYIISVIYKLIPDINILFLSQSLSLCFTTIPLWLLCKKNNLSSKVGFLVGTFWLLQPVVFNINLFDFHPEVWAMPCIAFYYYFEKNKNFSISILLTVLILGTRDGLVLLIFGFGLEQILKKKFRRALILFLISILWFLFLNNLMYPILNGDKGSVMALARYSNYGDSFKEILFTLFLNPLYVLKQIKLIDSIFYLLILFAPALVFLKNISFITLISSFPLVFSNILSESSSQRTLIHQYSLPIALVIVVSVINGLANNEDIFIYRRKTFLWMIICWAALAKPLFFAGPYLSRLDSIIPAREAFKEIPKNANVITTSYLVPHLSQRSFIKYPKNEDDIKSDLKEFNILLLNPLDPGWDSSNKLQKEYIKTAKENNWDCFKWDNGLELCEK